MDSKRYVLFGAVIGAAIGYLILSPFAMVVSDYVHKTTFGTPFRSFMEVFSREMLVWALAFTTFGGVTGGGIGILFAKLWELEEEIHESNEFLNSIIDCSADAIVTTDAKGIITTWNRGAEELYGYKAKEILGKPVDSLYPKELREERKKWQKSITEGKTLRNIPTKIYNSAGELVDISLSLAPLNSERGEIIGTVGVSKEVTEHRQIEEQIAAERTKLENIVKGIGAGLSLLDSETKILWANEVLQEWFGPIEEIKGKPCYELYSIEDPKKDCTALHTLSSGQIEHGGSFAKDIKGEKRYFQLTAAPIKDKAGKIVQIVELTQDVTERKKTEEELRESEEKYRNLFENANDSIFIIDPTTHRFLDVNENAAKRLGYTREELLKLTIDDIDTPMAAKRNKEIIEELQNTGSIVFEHAHRRKDGTEMPVEISSRVIEFTGKKVFQSFVRDVSERKQADDEFKKKVEELEKWYKFTVDREVRMKELKKEIKELKEEIERLRGGK